MGEIWAWITFFFFSLIDLLIMLVYQLICLADLEFDYINPYTTASRINRTVLPEYIAQAALCILYLVTGHWVMALLSIPYLYFNERLYMRKRHLVDVTEIFNLLKWEKKYRLFKLGHIFLLLCISLFGLIYTTLAEDERALHY